MSSPYPQRLTGFARRFPDCHRSGHSSVIGGSATRLPRTCHAQGRAWNFWQPVRLAFRGHRAGLSLCRVSWLPDNAVHESPRRAGECLPLVPPRLSGGPSALASRWNRWRPGRCHFQNRLSFCPGTEKTPARASVFSLQRVKKTSVTIVTFIDCFFSRRHRQSQGSG